MPTPDEIDDEWKGLDGSKSSIDAACAFLKTTKGGSLEFDDAKAAAEDAGATPSALGSPFVLKSKKHA